MNVPRLRGLLASLGASVSLVAAGALALLAISAVVALEGWPGMEGGAGGRILSIGQLTAPRSASGEEQAGGPVVVAEAPDADEPASPDGPGPAEDLAPVSDEPAPAPPAPIPPATPEFRPPSTPGPQGPVPPLDFDDDDNLPTLNTGRAVCGLTGTTGKVLSGTGETLSPVTEALLSGSGATVEGLTDDLGDSAENTGCTLDKTLEQLLDGSS